MRVVLDGRCIQDHFPGIARYAFNLALALADHGPRDELIVLVDPTARNRQYDLGVLAATPGVRPRTVDAPVFRINGMARVTQLLGELRPDVYHSPYYLRPLFWPSRSVVTIFDLLYEKRTGAQPYPTLATVRRVIFRLAIGLAIYTSNRVIVPSDYVARDLRLNYRTSPAKIVTLPLGVDAAFARVSAARVAELRLRYALPRRFILAVGVNKPHKNLDGLVQAVALLGAATDVALVLAGPLDPRFPQGNALARRHGVEDRVTVLGEVPASDLPALYSAAAAFAFPSFEEGFGLPPLEAMACGTPVVCSAASALPEVVGDAALLVDPADASAIAVALRRVLDDASLRERLIESGLARVARLRWPPIAAATWQVYREVAGSC